MLSQKDMVDQFNATYELNHPVWYEKDNGSLFATFTRSHAWQLGDGSPVVSVEGYRGGVDIERITTRTLNK